MIVIAAAGLGAYMAMNIGANDVANNMGPAVGANATGERRLPVGLLHGTDVLDGPPELREGLGFVRGEI